MEQTLFIQNSFDKYKETMHAAVFHRFYIPRRQ